MHAMKLRRIANPAVLKRIGRQLLTRFFNSFQRDFESGATPAAWPLPPPELPDPEYFRALAGALMNPEALPAALNEALCAIDEMGSPQGHAALEANPLWIHKRSVLKPDSTREDIAMQLWLADPDFLASVHNRMRMRRLTAFEHAAHAGRGPAPEARASVLECASPLALSKGDAPAEKPQDEKAIPPGSNIPSLHPSTAPPLPHSTAPLPELDHLMSFKLADDLDKWFLENGRGSETTHVEVFPIGREYWFMIRHGDLFTRVPKVEQQVTSNVFFRPERDDLVIYSPALDELRVNARTRGERDLYIRKFGLHLRGNEDYFSNRATYTLDPLRTAGADSLDPRQVEGVEKIRLRELEVADHNGEREIITRATQGIFEFAAANPGRPDPIPNEGRLLRAIFEIQFSGSARSFPVEIRLPNVLKVSRNCNATAVQDWLCASGFRRGAGLASPTPVPKRTREPMYVTPQLL